MLTKKLQLLGEFHPRLPSILVCPPPELWRQIGVYATDKVFTTFYFNYRKINIIIIKELK